MGLLPPESCLFHLSLKVTLQSRKVRDNLIVYRSVRTSIYFCQWKTPRFGGASNGCANRRPEAPCPRNTDIVSNSVEGSRLGLYPGAKKMGNLKGCLTSPEAAGNRTPDIRTPSARTWKEVSLNRSFS